MGHYLPTAKNDMVKNFFKSFGFEKVSELDGGGSKWALAVKDYHAREVFMTEAVNEL